MKEKIIKLVEDKKKERERLYDRYIDLNPQDDDRKRIQQIIMWEYDEIIMDIRNMEE